jgi:hydrogenase expression/formation protein HypE
MNFPESLSCPLPIMEHNTVQLAHGAGGKLSHELIEKMFLPRFQNDILNKMDDHALLTLSHNCIAFTTDSFVVSPLFFPGGNIGTLAINGTINDLCMSGATPLYMSAGFIIEEGFSMESLHRILISMEKASREAHVKVVTGDTKVVHKGACDQIFINTSGIGVIPDNVTISASNLSVGDYLIISGTCADHGMAIMTTREGLSFETTVTSDTSSLNDLVKEMLTVTHNIHAMRDPTRGGIAATVNEFAQSSHVGIELYEDKIPIKDDVRGACEVLGIDPLHVANEGKLIASVPKHEAQKVLHVMKSHKYGKDAQIIGEVVNDHPNVVVIITLLGTKRIVDMPLGEQLPRIC